VGLHIGPACEADLSAGMWREHVPPHTRKKKERKSYTYNCRAIVSCRWSMDRRHFQWL